MMQRTSITFGHAGQWILWLGCGSLAGLFQVLWDWVDEMDLIAPLSQAAGILARTRKLELEIELIDKREPMLPPHSYPWDWPDRCEQVWNRKRQLRYTRAERNWASLS